MSRAGRTGPDGQPATRLAQQAAAQPTGPAGLAAAGPADRPAGLAAAGRTAHRPAGLAAARPATGPQGWQQPGQPTGPQGWQQHRRASRRPAGLAGSRRHPPGHSLAAVRPQPANRAGRQQPAPTQGYPAQGYPNQGPGGPGRPWQPYPGQQPAPAPKNRTPLIITAIAVVVALVAAAGIYLFAIKDSKRHRGTHRPGQPAGVGHRAVHHAEQLRSDRPRRPARPGRGRPVHRPEHRHHHRAQAARGAQPGGVRGLDDRNHDHRVRPDHGRHRRDDQRPPADRQADRRHHHRRQRSVGHPAQRELQAGVRRPRSTRPSRSRRPSTSPTRSPRTTAQPIRVATVKRGDQWYVSLFYTIADNAVHQAGLPNPTVRRSPPMGRIRRKTPSTPSSSRRRQGDLDGVIARAAARRDGRPARLRPGPHRPGRRGRPVVERARTWASTSATSPGT